MATLNKAVKSAPIFTHEGGRAKKITAAQELERTVMACLLWEDSFYEEGEAVADRIKRLVHTVPGKVTAALAIKARTEMKLRHVPLLMVRELARHPKVSERKYVAETLTQVIQRPDELTEYLAIYWKDGKEPLSAQSKRGLADAFVKFEEYALAKYNRDGAVKLRDVLFLSHAKPENKKQEKLFKKVVNNELKTPDTWEVALSGGADKGETFERLIREEKLGALALLRNLRNMDQSGVPKEIVRSALTKMDVSRVLPFRFISAANHAPDLEPELEQAMYRALEKMPKLEGKTLLLVDNSGSMYDTKVSAKSDIDRSDAACALAILLREICEDVSILSFSAVPALVPARRGFALKDAIKRATQVGSTNTNAAKLRADAMGYDRIIIVTDEQSADNLSVPKGKGYVINVANYQNGIGYGQWTHLDGWSESVVNWIQAFENE
jgi:60 kDa SS-A/Ro ribonucleoprotein